MEIVFLGTSCMMPTKKRAQAGVFFSYGSTGLLFDCGEGTQRQLRIAGIKPTRITKILLSHWHGDHVLGLPGLIQTLGGENYNKKLEIYGPKDTKKYMENMFKSFICDINIEIEIFDVDEGKFFENEEFYLEAKKLVHRCEILGFCFVEKDKRKINLNYIKKIGLPKGPLLGKLQKNKKIIWKNNTIYPGQATYVIKGKKISYITDTMFCDACVMIAKNADLLIAEAVYVENLKEKAKKYKHLTAKDAALIAKKANVKKLVLTHFSQRYKTTTPLKEEAKNYFNNVMCAEDFKKIIKI